MNKPLMLIARLGALALATLGVVALALPLTASGANESQQIDRFVEQDLIRQKTRPLPASTDEEFLRRIYLDIIGRIPTYEEAKSFLDHEAPNKRSLLINELLDSEGYVSHSFNWWADLLRIKSNIQDGDGDSYARWMKGAIRENKPYNEIVSDLISAKGFTWDNGAVGYYLRDSGMPLDNMSNTTQVFLGTRLVCAQCHNHPFDDWKQTDYYEMAAYTYNSVDTRVRPEQLGFELSRRNSDDRYVREAFNDLFQPLSYGVYPTERNLQLPHDYQYSDADPYDEVKPSTMFGDRARPSRGQDLRAAYADWLTSRDNARFTTVYVNRLWKRVFGRGIVEPVDGFKGKPGSKTESENQISNRYALDHLTRLAQQKDYDTKSLLRILFNTRTYQRQAFGDDIPEDTLYHFQGPVLRRMTGEQLWDSFMTVAVPDLDERKTNRSMPGESRYQSEAEKLLALDKKDVEALAKSIADLERDLADSSADLRRQALSARESGDTAKAREIQKQIEKLVDDKEKAANKLKQDAYASASTGSPMMSTAMTSTTAMMDQDGQSADSGYDDSRWSGYEKDYVRASELESPAPNGHFLQQFGQSDRETIDNSSTQPSVDQALTLLNSPIFDQMFHEKSKLAQDLAKATTEEQKQDTLFLGLLSRYPRENERALITQQVEKYGEAKAVRNVAWALINTQEFCFMQ
ncbi:hypothetical protein BH23VER1_BH23VER1_20030 [soil metagenome]